MTAIQRIYTERRKFISTTQKMANDRLGETLAGRLSEIDHIRSPKSLEPVEIFDADLRSRYPGKTLSEIFEHLSVELSLDIQMGEIALNPQRISDHTGELTYIKTKDDELLRFNSFNTIKCIPMNEYEIRTGALNSFKDLTFERECEYAVNRIESIIKAELMGTIAGYLWGKTKMGRCQTIRCWDYKDMSETEAFYLISKKHDVKYGDHSRVMSDDTGSFAETTEIFNSEVDVEYEFKPKGLASELPLTRLGIRQFLANGTHNPDY